MLRNSYYYNYLVYYNTVHFSSLRSGNDTLIYVLCFLNFINSKHNSAYLKTLKDTFSLENLLAFLLVFTSLTQDEIKNNRVRHH